MTVMELLFCCGAGPVEIDAWTAVVAAVVAAVVVVDIVDVTLVLRSAITGSAGTVNSTVHVATSRVNGVISFHVPFLRMNGAMSEFGILHG